MRSGTIAFLGGILFLQQWQSLPQLYWLWMTVLLLPSALIVRHRLLRLCCLMVLGFLWALLHAHLIMDNTLPAELEGDDVEVTGRVASLPIQRDRLWRFEFDVDTLEYNDTAYDSPGRIRLSWYDATATPQVGERWRFAVRLKQPHGFMNPGGFDYEKWLFSQHIRATGYVRNRQSQSLLSADSSGYPLQRLRGELRERIRLALPDHPLQGVVTALTIGERSAISPQQWRILRDTGTNHLIAISGLHIGFIAGLIYFLVNWLWARLGQWPLYLPAPKAAAVAAIIAALCYAALAGWSIPTQRAFIMVSVVMGSILFMRVTTPSRTLALAMFLVLLHDPMAVLSAGLWLSFAAVAIILFGIRYNSQRSRWRQWGRLQWLVSLGLLPLLLALFQQASLVSPLANLIAIPIVSLLLVPALLLALLLSSFTMGQLLFEWAAAGLQLLTDLLGMFASWPYILLITPSPDVFRLFLAMSGVLLLLMPRGWPARWLGLVFLLPLFSYKPEPLQPGELRLSLLDVGQGLATVLRTQNHILVFDTGARFSDAFDGGAAVVVPFLRQQAISRVDRLILSHGDNDHIGGSESLLANYTVTDVITSQPEKLFLDQVRLCQSGARWDWDGVSFNILHPDGSFATAKENDRSCVLQIVSPHGRILIPGDIEEEAEVKLVERYGSALEADILIAPHHGSKTSSTELFLNTVQPSYALFAVGYRNRYRFPHEGVKQRYQARGVQMFDTAQHGAIEMSLTSATVQPHITTHRQAARRYWHHDLSIK